ncbi:MAG TPA: amino acid permease, partial [Gemmatimonadaceae bacterium]|nr:amino acid permease [Gemmatimonadaceae bacterium]
CGDVGPIYFRSQYMTVPRSSSTVAPDTSSTRPARAPPPVPATWTDERLPRQLGFWSTVALTVGLIIGAGIFRASSAVAASAGSVGRIMIVWIAGGVIALCGALSMAELGTMFPRAGGIYIYLREGYGRPVAFLWGWTALIIQPASIGTLSLVFAEYLGTFVPLTTAGTKLVAAAAVLMAAAASYRSTRWTARIQGAATGAKLLALAGIVVLIFALAAGTRGSLAMWSAPARGAMSPASGGTGWSQLGLALIAALWPYGGWQHVGYMAGEVREPGRTLPRALLVGLVIVVIAYLATNAAYLYALPLATLVHSPLVAADAMRSVAGPVGSATISALVMLSAFGTLTAALLVFPRLFYALAADGLAARKLGSVHPRYRTPHAAVAFLATAAIVLGALRTVDQLRELQIVGAWPFLSLTVLAVPVLRHRRPDVPRPYRTLGYPLVPILFVAASLALLSSAVIEHRAATLASFIYTLLGIPVYVGIRAAARRHALA